MSATVFQRLALLTAIGLAGTTLFACQSFPECDEDADCTNMDDSDKQKQDPDNKLKVCVNKICRECSDDTHCADGYECKFNTCKLKPECLSDSDCTGDKAGMICVNQKCKWECAANSDCAAGSKCEKNKCVPDIQCTSDGDCGPDQVCQGNKCVPKPKAPLCSLDRIHFDFDKYDIRGDAKPVLQANAKCLQDERPNDKVKIEGHCDERGTTEYNLALGERRANAAKKYLQNLGIKGDRLSTVSYGEEQPIAYGSNEDSWAKNRRAEFPVQ